MPSGSLKEEDTGPHATSRTLAEHGNYDIKPNIPLFVITLTQAITMLGNGGLYHHTGDTTIQARRATRVTKHYERERESTEERYSGTKPEQS